MISGGYLLRRQANPALTLVGMGAVMPDVLEAADRLDTLGLSADVVCLTSAGLLFAAVQARRGLGDAATWILDSILPAERSRPKVTVWMVTDTRSRSCLP